MISIGVVAEDGREYYAVSTEFDPERAAAGCAPMCCPSCRRPPRNCGARASRFVLTWKNSSASTARIRSSCGPGWGLRPCSAVSIVGPDDCLATHSAPFHPGTAAVVGGPGMPPDAAAATRRPRRAGRCPRSAAPVSSHHVHRRCGPRRGPLRRRTVRSRRRGPPSEPRPEQPSGNPRLPWTDELDRRHTDRPAPVASAAAD